MVVGVFIFGEELRVLHRSQLTLEEYLVEFVLLLLEILIAPVPQFSLPHGLDFS